MTTTDSTEKQLDHPMPERARKAPPSSGGPPSTDAQVKMVSALLRERFALGR